MSRGIGRTIIEKLEGHRDVGGAIVLLTPDDELLRPTDQGTTEAIRRARQNVIAELGFFVGLLGRSQVIVALKKHPDFDIPSDFLGLAYIEVDRAGRWRLDVARELQHAGFSVDLAKVP